MPNEVKKVPKNAKHILKNDKKMPKHF